MRYRVGLGLPRMKGSGGYKRPRLKTTCGDNGGRNRLGLPCRCKELFKRGKPIERGAAIKAGIEALTRYRAQRNGRIGSRTREGATT
jgi:hypothetical protein